MAPKFEEDFSEDHINYGQRNTQEHEMSRTERRTFQLGSGNTRIKVRTVIKNMIIVSMLIFCIA